MSRGACSRVIAVLTQLCGRRSRGFCHPAEKLALQVGPRATTLSDRVEPHRLEASRGVNSRTENKRKPVLSLEDSGKVSQAWRYQVGERSSTASPALPIWKRFSIAAHPPLHTWHGIREGEDSPDCPAANGCPPACKTIFKLL